MKYRFYGDKLQLVKYTVSVPRSSGMDAETYDVATDEERDSLLAEYPNAEFTEVDNSGYEWLDGMMFTQEQRLSGEIEQAIGMGQAAYETMKKASDQNEINAMLLLKIAELTIKLTEVEGNE